MNAPVHQNPYDLHRRQTGYEAFEPRLVLSAQGWDELASAVPLPPAPAEAEFAPATQPSNPAEQLRADLAYIRERYGLRGEGQTVAIIDSGIAYDHIALGGGIGPNHRVVGGWDFTEKSDADPYDDPPGGFHGTHVAGVIASDDDQYPGVATQVDLVALRVLNDQGAGRFEWVEDALQWVHENRDYFEHPITTVNLSVGANSGSGDAAPWEMLEDELAQLEADGIFVAVAAGNEFAEDGSTELTYPAASSHVVPVASLHDDGQLSEFSQRDPRIIAVAGEGVMSTVPGHVYGGGAIANDFARAHGTSMAAPYVAGASTLVREAMETAGYEDIDQDRIANHLRETADAFHDPATDQTYLRMNLRAAIDGLLANRDVTAEAPNASVATDGRTIRVTGAVDADSIEVRFGAELRIAVNGESYDFDSSRFDRITLQGNGGFDTALIHGSDDDETVRAFPDRVEIASATFSTIVTGFQQVDVRAGEGNDVAHLYDSEAGDRLYAYEDRSTLRGAGYQNRVSGFDRVYAYADSGGHDVANVYDSSGNDRFYARPDHWTMSGLTYQNRAIGFDRVNAHATLGGDDQAILYDTAEDDRFHSRATEASLSSVRRQTHVHGFDRVSALAVAGGQDRAYFHNSLAVDRFDGQPTGATMSGLGYHNLARGFDQYYAESGGEGDVAELHGSFADDLLSSTAHSNRLVGRRFETQIEHFAAVRVFGGGGTDRATLTDVDGSQQVLGRGDRAVIATEESSRSINDFAELLLIGDQVQADLDALEYVFRQAGQ